MKKKNCFKLYMMELMGLMCLAAILLPWISYGVGSKTGLDIGRTSVETIVISGILFLLFSYLNYKIEKIEKFTLYVVLLLSTLLFGVFVLEIIRIGYQSSITKNLPVEMFGVASLATTKIHIGYGLWLGGAASFIMFLVNLISLKIFK